MPPFLRLDFLGVLFMTYRVRCRQKGAPAGAHWLMLPAQFATMSEALLAAYRARRRFHLLQFSVVAQ